jgi:hypothetical protein
VVDRSGIVQKLEDKVAAALRDHNLTAAAGGTPAAQSAMAEYDRLVKDADSPVGIRYLALHSVAVKQGFYVDKRDQQEMLGTVSQEMGNMSPTEVLSGIKYLKSNYPAIYQCDAVALDRKESSIVELMTRLPMDQQDRAVAEAKNVQLEARPINLAPIEIPVVAPQPFSLPPQPIEPVPIPVSQAYTPQSTQTYSPQSTQTYTPQQTQLPAQNTNNKSALIIGGGMIAGAILFSTILLSQQSKPSKLSTNTVVSNSHSTEIKITPDKAVINHYKLIQDRRLDESWQDLSTSFQGSNLAKGVSEYKAWWNSVDSVNIGSTEILEISQNKKSATVKADLRYKLRTGREIIDQKKYIYLVWDNDRWLINEKSDIYRKIFVERK